MRVALVDDHPTLLRGLAAIFASDPRYEVVATGGSADDAKRIGGEERPDIMVLDLSMPGDVFAATSEMVRAAPSLKLVVFTAFANVELALRAFDSGAHAFVLKGGASDDLFDAVDAVSRGELYVSPDFSHRLLGGYRAMKRQGFTAAPRLTVREQQIAGYLLDARTNAEMAAAMRLTEKVMRHYLDGLMSKVDARSRLEAVRAILLLPEFSAERSGD